MLQRLKFRKIKYNKTKFSITIDNLTFAGAFVLAIFLFVNNTFANDLSWKNELIESVKNAKVVREYNENESFESFDTVKFGNYKGYGPTEWVILEKRDNKALLLSKYIIKYYRYSADGSKCDYNSSSICDVANSHFVNETFKYDERQIMDKVDGHKIFLLNEELIYKHFGEKGKIANGKLRTKYFNTKYLNTEYHGYSTDEIINEYWIDETGNNNNLKKYINADGNIEEYGDLPDRMLGFRPLICIDLDKECKRASIETQIKSIKNYYECGTYNKNYNYLFFDMHSCDTVLFGKYEQDNNFENGKEDIEWIIIDVKDGKVKLLSKYILDRIAFKTSKKDELYEDSYFRYWLNNIFYNIAFEKEEKEKILYEKYDERKNIYDYILLCGDTKIRDETYYTKYAYQKNFNHFKDLNKSVTYTKSDYWRKRIDGSSNGVRPAIWIKVDDIKDINIEKIIEDKKSTIPDEYEDIIVYNASDNYEILNRKTEKQRYNLCEINKAKLVSEYDEKSNVEQYDTVVFGSYEQDNNIENGKEDIEWLVLDRNEDRALLISKYILDDAIYNMSENKVGYMSEKIVGWDQAAVRFWCNSYFLDEAFENDKDIILETYIKNLTYPIKEDLDGGMAEGFESKRLKDTKDKVFLLGIDEARKYFDYNTNYHIENVKIATTKTEFAKSNNSDGEVKADIWSYGNFPYMLRTVGYSWAWGGNDRNWGADIYSVYGNGSINSIGYYGAGQWWGDGDVPNLPRPIDSDYYKRGVRPMIWIDLKNVERLKNVKTSKPYVKKYEKNESNLKN